MVVLLLGFKKTPAKVWQYPLRLLYSEIDAPSMDRTCTV